MKMPYWALFFLMQVYIIFLFLLPLPPFVLVDDSCYVCWQKQASVHALMHRP